MPKANVLMSFYNCQRYILQAIDSVLGQPSRDFEFLIINDGCTDKSREIILSFNDTRIPQVDNPTGIGLTKSLNHVLEPSEAEFITRQNANDISYPTRLTREIQFLGAHPQVVFLGTSARAVDERAEK